MDYMEQPHELKKHPNAIEHFKAIAGGNTAALSFLWSLWCFEHAFDDLIDESSWPVERKEMALKALHDFVNNLLVNPFVRDNAFDIRAMLVSMINRQLDGDKMKAEGNPLAEAVACGDIDLGFHIAYLVGGWDRMRALSKNPLTRIYDKPDGGSEKE